MDLPLKKCWFFFIFAAKTYEEFGLSVLCCVSSWIVAEPLQIVLALAGLVQGYVIFCVDI